MENLIDYMGEITPNVEGLSQQKKVKWNGLLALCEEVTLQVGEGAKNTDLIQLGDKIGSEITRVTHMECEVVVENCKRFGVYVAYMSPRNMTQPNDELRDPPEWSKYEGKGSIDLATGIVGGVFRKIPSKLMMDLRHQVRKNRLNGRELCAEILHEVGHMFDNLVKAHRTVRTNAFLEDIAANRHDEFDVKQYETVFRKLKDDTVLTNKMKKVILSSKTRSAFDYHLSKSLINDGRSDTYLSDLSSDGMFEATSDSYAVKNGYGIPLATALAKEKRKETYPTTRILSLVMNVKTARVLGKVVRGVIRFWVFIVFSQFNFIATLASRKRESTRDHSYDTNLRRMERIKNDLVTRSRELPRDTETYVEISDQLNVMSEICAEMASTRTDEHTLYNKLGRLILRGDNEIHNIEKFQHLLEDLNSHEFHVSYDRISDLAASNQ